MDHHHHPHRPDRAAQGDAVTTYDDPATFRAAWRAAQRAKRRPRKPRADTSSTSQERFSGTKQPKRARRPSPVVRLALAGYTISHENAAGDHWFSDAAGHTTPRAASLSLAARVALDYLEIE